MKCRAICISILVLLSFPSLLHAQGIAPSFEEGVIQPCADSRVDLHPNPDFNDLPSLDLYVIAVEIPRIFGYEYNLSVTNDTGTSLQRLTCYPHTSLNFGGYPGDVRVGTGECFWAGGAEAGPNPNQIRLTKYEFAWLSLPTENIQFCVRPAINSGALTPQYTQCVPTPTPLPLEYVPTGYGWPWATCAFALFNFTGYEDFPFSCNPVVGTASKSWGALKAAY